MNRRMQRLELELALGRAAPELDATSIKQQVNAALNADPSERKAYMKQKIRLAAVLVAAVVALCGTAVAVAPTLKELLDQAMGSFAPYAQEVDGVSATDQGIEIKVVSAVADHVNAKIILGVRDLTGSRISGADLNLRIEARRELEDPHGWSWWQECIGYDPTTKTALYQLDFSGMHALTDEPANNTPLTLDIGYVQTGYQNLSGTQLPAELTIDKALDSRRLDTGERVLLPGQTPAELAGAKGVALSSIGFASDGLFHIQIRLPKGVREQQNYIHFDLQTDYDFEYYKRFNDETRTIFYEGETSYMDFQYPITRADIGKFEIVELYGSFLTEERIEGSWSLTVPLEELPIRTLSIDQALGGTMIKTISMTALSASAETERIPDARPYYGLPGIQLTLYLRDGMVIPIDDESNWRFDHAVIPSNVVALAVGQWYIPLNGDNALPGHWLREQPQ